MASTTPPTHQTQAQNANKHPGQVVLDSQPKRQTKAPKTADDQALKDAQVAREQAETDAISRLTDVEMRIEEEHTMMASWPPVHPHPHVITKTKKVTKKASYGKQAIIKGSAEKDVIGEELPVASQQPTRRSFKEVLAAEKDAIGEKLLVASQRPARWSFKEVLAAERVMRHAEIGQPGAIAHMLLLLTEATLFFRDLALNTRAKKHTFHGHIKDWQVGVHTDDSMENPASNAKSASASCPPLLLTVCSTKVNTATNISQISMSGSKLKIRHEPEANNTTGFEDNVNVEDERMDTIATGSKMKQVVNIIPAAADSDDELATDVPISEALTSLTSIATTTTKRKFKEVVDISDDEPEEEVDQMNVDELTHTDKPIALVAETVMFVKRHCATASTSVGISIVAPPMKVAPLKKIKVEAGHTDIPSSGSSMRSVSNTALQVFDEEGYLVEAIKNDTHWSCSLLGMIILWAGAQKNPWCIPKEELVLTVQLIWDLIYPNMKYRVTAQGSVIAIVVQHHSEWRNGFGSAALSLMISFFVKLSDDEDAPTVAKDLLDDYAFLDKDPDNPSVNGQFPLTFLLELLSTTHFCSTSGYIEVPGWKTHELAGGMNMASIIALAAAALEDAVQFSKDGIINIKDIQAAVEVSGWLDPRFIKLQKVINPQTGKETCSPYMFSADN